MISHHALNLMVKYDGTTFKSEENFVNVRERLLEIAGGPDVYQYCYFQKT